MVGGTPRGWSRARSERSPSLGLRLLAFAALAAFTVGHWVAMVGEPPVLRAAAVVAVATAGGATIALAGRLRARLARVVLPPLLVLATVAAGLVTMGLPLRLLAPRNRAELQDGLDHGLTGLVTVEWPYTGGDHWLRLVFLLGAPLVAGLAAGLAFWPARRLRPVLGAAGLLLLLVLFGFAVTENDFAAEPARGALLLILIATWLWLPRLPRSRAPAALAALVGAGLLALSLTPAIDAREPWVDYESWDWSGESGGQGFRWDHTYGPIDWPRKGTEVLRVRAPRALYLKAEVLDEFEGVRWVRSGVGVNSRPQAELPENPRPKWYEQLRFEVKDLRTELLIGAGMTQVVRGAGATHTTADGTSLALDGALEEGDRYGVLSYVPDPSPREMRRATVDTIGLERYASFSVSEQGKGGGGMVAQPEVDTDAARQPANPPLHLPLGIGGRTAFTPEDRAAEARVLASPYARVYSLARRLGGREPTVYDAVRRIGSYLQENYTYEEQVPERPFPLRDFLFRDKAGYCQQFSGAMALMLRMNGIPARVVAGFSSGTYDRERNEYRVTDRNAHSWVEAHFGGIGWVTFDPTPEGAPARSESGQPEALGDAAPLDAGGAAANRRGELDLPESGAAPNFELRGGDGGDGEQSSDRALGPLLIGVAVLLGALAALLGATGLRRRLAAVQLGPDPDAAVSELRSALPRLGYRVEPGTTLVRLEQRLGRIAGPAGARYARRLREGRFAPGAGGGPTPAERRALRRALTRHGGPLRKLRGLVALPPRRSASR